MTQPGKHNFPLPLLRKTLIAHPAPPLYFHSWWCDWNWPVCSSLANLKRQSAWRLLDLWICLQFSLSVLIPPANLIPPGGWMARFLLLWKDSQYRTSHLCCHPCFMTPNSKPLTLWHQGDQIWEVPTHPGHSRKVHNSPERPRRTQRYVTCHRDRERCIWGKKCLQKFILYILKAKTDKGIR
jgi:hypothetical protein